MLKNGEVVKPERMTGSPATKLFDVVAKVTVAVGPVPELVQPVIEAALSTGARMFALGLMARQLIPFTLKSGE